MNTKNDVEVIINGKQYTLSGYESSEYLQKIANHINDKLTERIISMCPLNAVSKALELLTVLS